MLSVILWTALGPGLCQDPTASSAETRPRARELGIEIGAFSPGEHNAITDVPGVLVGHTTVIAGDDVRTGVTVVRPHPGNPYQQKVPAAVCVQNGYGKLSGTTQIIELGELESPIALTNTLDVGDVQDALVAWLLDLDGNASIRSVNAVVGETNDGYLNAIRKRPVEPKHVRSALSNATAGTVTEGSVGAGTGTVCFGFKGGIGTSSRILGDYTLGVLVQSNFGGELRVDGRPWQPAPPPTNPGNTKDADKDPPPTDDGSCMIIVATDAPLDSRNLGRLAKRALTGMARTGASFSNGSGDYVIAFCTAPSQRIVNNAEPMTGGPILKNQQMSPLFRAAADATEEAILNSMLRAISVTGQRGRTVTAIPIEQVRQLLESR